MQPVVALQESAVQALLSLQLIERPPQAPPKQLSPVVQALLSLQTSSLGEKTQPIPGLQASSVQGSSSLQ
jgi:hypothetical protein